LLITRHEPDRSASVPADDRKFPQLPFTQDDQHKLDLLCNQNGIEFVGPPIA
jgi:hypothetical protein